MTTNQLPVTWEECTLWDAGEWFGGGTPKKSEERFWNGIIPWVSPKDMKTLTIADTEDHISLEAISESATRMIPSGSVLFVVRSGILAHSFPVSTSQTALTINQDLKAILPTPAIDPEYLAWCLRANARPILNQCTKNGTTVHSIEVPRLRKFRIPIPPLNEQLRIVTKIEKVLSELDKGIESLKTAHQQLKVYRQALLKHVFEGQLTKEWRSSEVGLLTRDQLKERLNLQRQLAWKAPGKPYHRGDYALPVDYDDKDPPIVPETWALMSMDACCEHITSGSRGWSRYYGRGSSIFILAQNIRPGRYADDIVQDIDPPTSTPEAQRTKVQPNDLLVTIVGANTGNLCRFPLNKNDHYVCQSVALMRLVIPEYARFLEFYFQASTGGKRQFDRYIYGAGRPHLSFEQLRKTVVPIPDPREAAQIVAEIEAIFSKVDQVEATINAELIRANTLRQSILQKAFSGQLVPQDPNDEPASVLLERIRAEKTAPEETDKPKGRRQPRRKRTEPV